MHALSITIMLVLFGAVITQNVTKIVIGQGATFVLRLPGTECGQYTLLNGLLRPVLVIEKNAPKLLGDYAMRSEITRTDSGFDLKMKEASLEDNGRYKVASSKQNCKDIQFYVTVKAIQQAYLEQWGGWSACTKACDSSETRSRTRNCSVNGGCQDLGPLEETQACNLADNCAHWSDWSPFGECSAKCGKGFKIRSRNCLKSSSSLLSTGDCVGPSMQSHLCMTVCEIVGVWTGWAEWSGCFPECGDRRIRNRTRLCNDPRETPGCPGNYTEYGDCRQIKCQGKTNETVYNTTTVSVISETEVASASWLSKLNLVVFLVIAGAITLIILIVIFMLVRRRLKVKRINSARLTRDTQVENATIDKRLTQAAKRGSRPDGVNVYSELGSSFCYNDSEFDDTEDEDGEDTKKDDNRENKSVEEQENKANDALISEDTDTYTNTQGQDSKDDVIVYDNNIPEATRNLSSVDSLYSDPPEEEDSADELKNDEVFSEPHTVDSDDHKPVDTNENKGSGSKLFKELTGLFTIPTLKKKSSKQETNKSLDDMYKKVNKNRDKPPKVEINHERDVYYDPPEYNETADMDSFDDDSPEVDNVYENCDVTEGNMKIIPATSDMINSERKVSDTLKQSNGEKIIENKEQTLDNESDMHWKMKEALEENESALKTSEIIDNLLGDTKTEGSEHVYVNEEITKDMKNFYVLPRRKSNHIYDVPKSPK